MKSRRVQLLAYAQRMPDDLPVKVALNWRPEGGKGSRGRAKTFLLQQSCKIRVAMEPIDIKLQN